MNYLKESEWSDLKVSIDGKTITGITNISYKKTSSDELMYGAGKEPLGIQSGNNGYEGSIKLLKNEFDALNLAARLLGYDDIVDVPGLVITAAYMPKGGRLLKTDTLTGVKINEAGQSFEQGAQFMEIDLPFKFLNKKSA